MEKVYTLGVDFGSTSCRTTMVDVRDGRILESVDVAYTHGVITEKLPNGQVLLGKRTALQVPNDYLESLKAGVHFILNKYNLGKEQIIGIGFYSIHNSSGCQKLSAVM